MSKRIYTAQSTMSQIVKPLQAIKIQDPRIVVNNVREFAIIEGGSEVSYKPVLSTSFSPTSAQFSAPPPSPHIFVDRKVYLRMNFRLQFTGVGAPGTGLLQSGYDAPRAFPLSSIISTLTATINNTSVSINTSDTITAVMRYNNNSDLREHEYSMSPSALDQSQNYSDLTNTVRNPLGSYGDSTEDAQMGRGAFPYVRSTFVNNQNDATVDIQITEPLFLSPFYFGNGTKSAFFGIQTMDFNFTFISDLARVWCHTNDLTNTNTISNIAVTIGGPPALLFNYITPKQLQPIPQDGIVYPYFNLERYPTDGQPSIPSNTTTEISSSNIQLNSVPRRMYIYARKRNSDLTFLDTDTFMSITKVSIQWGNRQGLLSSASQQDLYNISKKNGCNLSWTQWSGGPTQVTSGNSLVQFGTVGSVLALDFAEDIGLPELESPGSLGTWQLQMQVTVTNVNQTSAITPTLYIAIVNEGTFTLVNNRSVTQVGVITKKDVLEAPVVSDIEFEDLHDVYGGNFLSGLKSGFRRFQKGLKKAAPAITLGETALSALAPELLPVIEQERAVRKALGGKKGGALVGGKARSRDQLKRQLALL